MSNSLLITHEYKSKIIFENTKTKLCTVYLPSGYGTSEVTHYYKSLLGAKRAVTASVRKYGKGAR